MDFDFGSAANPSDADGDGWTNADEWLAGTGPADASSVFRIYGMSRSSGGDITASFPVMEGHRYRLERSEDLGTWTTVGAGFGAETTGDHSFSAPAEGAAGFFRAVAIARS